MAYANGKYPASALATTQLFYPGTVNGRQTRKNVQPHADALALAFALKFHKPLYATDGYRDYATQVQLKKEKGPYAATPGTSNHGWGLAFDLASNVNVDTSPEHRWMEQNAARFGFENPWWARNSTTADGMYEPWHWEFKGGGKSGPRVLPARKGEMGLGWRGNGVKKYQKLLNEKGSIKVAEDDDYGFMTGVAVAAIQAKAGITVNGRMTPATKRYLEHGVKPGGSKTPPKHQAPSKGVTRDVKRVQMAVGAKQDGIWGRDTSKRLWAVRTASVWGGFRFPYGVKYTQSVVRATADGVWGPGSARAHDHKVDWLQLIVGQKRDGVYGKKTNDALEALKKKARKS